MGLLVRQSGFMSGEGIPRLGVLVCSPQGVIIAAGPGLADLFGPEMASPVGMPLATLCALEEDPAAAGLLGLLLDRALAGIVEPQAAGRQAGPLRFNLRPIRTGQGEVSYIVVTITPKD